jgi:hypothetical protein
MGRRKQLECMLLVWHPYRGKPSYDGEPGRKAVQETVSGLEGSRSVNSPEMRAESLRSSPPPVAPSPAVKVM